MTTTLNLDYIICIHIKNFSLFLYTIMKDKKLQRIEEVISPWDANQLLRTCYLKKTWMITDKEFEDYINHIRPYAFENWYTEEDLQKCIKVWDELAEHIEGLTINK